MFAASIGDKQSHKPDFYIRRQEKAARGERNVCSIHRIQRTFDFVKRKMERFFDFSRPGGAETARMEKIWSRGLFLRKNVAFSQKQGYNFSSEKFRRPPRALSLSFIVVFHAKEIK